MIDRFPSGMKLPGVKEYATAINAEYSSLLEKNRLLAKRVEDLEAQLVDHSQLRKALSAKSARASRKRKSGAEGDFVNEQQKRRAVSEAVIALNKIADTSTKMEGVIDGVRKECLGIDVDDGIAGGTNAEKVEAKVLIADELIAHLDLFRAVLTGLSLDSGMVGKLRMHYNYLLGMATPATPLSKVGAGLLLPVRDPKAHRRADKLGEEAIRQIEEAWDNCSIASPNKNDTVTEILLDGTAVQHTKRYCYNRIEDVQAKLFEVEKVHRPISTVWTHKPAYIAKGKANTCLCESCEDVRNIKKSTLQASKQLRRPTVAIKAIYRLTKFVIAYKVKRRLMGSYNTGALNPVQKYAFFQLVSYADHVTTLRRQSFAGQQAIKNMLPHMVMCDVDFSENMEFTVTCVGKAGFHSGVVVEHYPGLDEVKIKLHYDPYMEVPAAVSNDPHHDHHFVHKFFENCWYGPSGFIAQPPEEQRRLLSHEIRHSDGAASHFKQRFTMENMYEEFEAADWSKRISWTFGCPRHGKCNCDVFGGIGKNTAERYRQRLDIVIQHAQHLYEILTLLFAADPERTTKHTTRKVKTTDWMIFYLPVEETMPLRGPDCYKDTFTVKLPDPIGLQSVFHIECLGTTQQPHPTQPRVVYRQFGVRRHACCCTACLSGESRDDEEKQMKKPRTQGPLVATINPDIPDCALREQWDYVHIRSFSMAEWNQRAAPAVAAPVAVAVAVVEAGVTAPIAVAEVHKMDVTG
ncbi:hypothetical protein B484DRAFT_403566 [Ochromonadaceae sp. CCMP2298]|nr:hypothetical protein B484DRAFT_403566 [Ochromonadaceae sp. CCMP2298]